MPPSEHPERRRVPAHLRHAVRLAEEAGSSGCKVLPGNTWGLHYPENGARRQQAIEGLLDGTAKPEEVAKDLRPDALIYDAADIERLSHDEMAGRIRKVTSCERRSMS